MSNREEIQITDLEPSIEGGQDIEYLVQIRGIDATGRPGPWSEELKFTSPQQIPSLQSSNYVPDEDGWRLDNDGTFEVNDGTIRGTLESSNYAPDVSGWRLSPNGFAEFGDGLFRGALRIGQNTFNVDPEGNLFIGGSSPGTAPFSVDTNGNILAMSIDAGLINAGTIGANVVYAGTIIATQISSGTINGQRIPNLNASKITAGEFDPVRIPNLDAGKITAGTLNANNVTISGTLSAVTLSGVSGTFSGNLTASVTQANGVRTSTITSPSGSNLSIVGVSSSMSLTASNNITILPLGNLNINAGGSINIQKSASISGGITVSSISDFNSTIRNAGMLTSTGVNVVAAGSAFVLRRESSSIKYKENVREAQKLPNILDIKPVLFDFKDLPEQEEESEKNVYGAIAEDVHNLGLSQLVYYLDGEPETIHYKNIGLALIPYVKELYDRIDELERKVNGS